MQGASRQKCVKNGDSLLFSCKALGCAELEEEGTVAGLWTPAPLNQKIKRRLVRGMKIKESGRDAILRQEK